MASCKSYQNRKHEIELLKQEVEVLKVTLRLYRDYILKNYNPDFVNIVDIVEIPLCLKSLDAIRYIGEIRGFNHQS